MNGPNAAAHRLENSGRSKRQHENNAINVMRTFAAVVVVVSHLRALMFVDYGDLEAKSPLTSVLYLATSLGSTAVLIFFVLSGYWVGGSVIRAFKDGGFSFRTYITNRLTRLWIVLVPALFLTAIVDNLSIRFWPNSSVNIGSAAYHTVVPGHVGNVYELPTFIGNIFFIQNIHVSTFGSNTPLWSLASEFWYYLMFPLALTALMGSKRTVRSLAAGFLVGCIAISGLDVLPGFLIWLMGAGLAWAKQERANWFQLTDRYKRSSVRTVRYSAIVGLLLAVLATKAISMNSVMSSLLVGASTVMLLATYLAMDNQSKPMTKAFRLIADYAHSSYSLYAIHLPLLAFSTAILVPTATSRFQPDLKSVLLGLAVLIVVVVLAIVFAAFTEKKTDDLRHWLQELRVSKTTSATLAEH